jgi:selenoprotein W-related protein
MVQAILDTFEHHIDSITVIPSRGGVFEVTVGDDLVFSKKELGRHATVEEVIEGIDAIVGPVSSSEGS